MEFRDLEFFEVIATVGHLGRAAEMLNRTQPALSKCIDRLEKEIGANLFEPSGRRLRLTRIGEILLRQAKSIRQTMEENLRQLSEQASGSAGLIKIGVGPTASEFQIPHLLNRLISHNKDIAVSAMIGPSDFLRAMLRDNQIDLLVGPLSAHDSEEFISFSLFPDEMVAAVSVNHPLASKAASLMELTKYKWLLPHRPIVGRVWLDQVFEHNGLQRPDVQVETNAVLSLLPLVSQRALITYVSRVDLKYGRARDTLREVITPEIVMKRDLGVAYSRHIALPPLAERFVAILRESSKNGVRPVSDLTSAHMPPSV
jgi:DNA-binding transcriptional LysR family regulator